MSDLQNLDNLLSSLLQLKPPGVSKSRVDAITKICTTAQVDRTQIIDAILAAFNRAPATHKLGALYVADSVVRLYIAGGSSQGLNNATAIQKLTAHMPALLDEITKTIPEEQKPRLSKLLDIWLGSKTFSADMLNSFKQRLDAPAPGNTNSTLSHSTFHRPGTDLAAAVPAPAPTIPTPAASTSNYAYQQPPQPVAAPPMAQPVSTPSAVSQAPYPPPVPAAAAQAFAAFQGLPVNVQNGAPYAAAAPVAPPPVVAAQNQAAVAQNAQQPPPAQGQQPALNPQQLQAIQSVVQANPSITADQLMAILSAMGVSVPQAAPPPVAAAPPPLQQQTQHYGHPGQDQAAYQRDRSRSPDYKRRRVTPPSANAGGRQSPTYGAYDPSAAAAKSETRGNDFDNNAGGSRRERGRNKGRGENVRKRSPPRERMASPSMMGRNLQGVAPKPFGHDASLPQGRIRVLSRTLFVGGVSASTNEEQLMDYIARYARVQSCIVNHDKRHAFLKLISHADAIAAKSAIDANPAPASLFERMNWAVGFGPTQYADYKRGESVLPIEVLTEADRKWIRTAEFGGTGGLEISTGMVVEEPDIEIGAGPSSKAISRRGGKGGFNNRNEGGGGRRERNRGGRHEHEDGGGYQRGGGGGHGGGEGGHNRRGGYGAGYDRQREQQPPMETHMPEPVNIGPPPPVPQFGALPFGLGTFR